MTDNHPITPPPELVEQWRTAPEYTTGKEMFTMVSVSTRRLQEVATQAARWGADQELEACCQEVQDWYGNGSRLHTARRPKPPSLKEQALALLDKNKTRFAVAEEDVIRLALESLAD